MKNIRLADLRNIIQDGFTYYVENNGSHCYENWEDIRDYEDYEVIDIYSDCGVNVVLKDKK